MMAVASGYDSVSFLFRVFPRADCFQQHCEAGALYVPEVEENSKYFGGNLLDCQQPLITVPSMLIGLQIRILRRVTTGILKSDNLSLIYS